MSSTTSLDIPDLTHALLWREAAMQSNRAATRDHELAREGLVEDLPNEAVWRSFATHYRAQRTLETDTDMLETLSGVDLLHRYQSEPIESIEVVLQRAERLKPIQLPNEVNPLAQQQVGLETRDRQELSEERSFREVPYQSSDAPIPGPYQGQEESTREKQRFSFAGLVKNLFGRKQPESDNSRLDESQGSHVASNSDHSDKFFDELLAKMQAERKSGFDAKVDEYVDFLTQRADEEKLPVTYAKKVAAANVDFVVGTIPKEELGESVTKDLTFTHSKIDLSGKVETLTNNDLHKLSERSIESGRIESKLDLNNRETWQDASFLGSYARLHAPNWAVFVNSLPFEWSREKPNPEHLREQLLPHHEKAEAIAQADRQRSEELHKQAGWSGDPKDYESWNRAEMALFKASSGIGDSPDIPALEEIEWTNSQTDEPDEEREALYHYLMDGVDGYLSHYRYSEDEPSSREIKEANRYADAVVAELQKENPGAGYGELLNRVQAQDQAEFHPSWDKPVIGPAEENAKAELLELLANKHISPWSLEHGTETSNELFERAERKAGDDLDRMVKANPNASYVELLAQRTAEETRSAGQAREFENSDLKADYNPLAGTVDTFDKQNNIQTHIIVPEIGTSPTQEQIETRLEEAKGQIEGEQEEAIEQKADRRSEQRALEDDRNTEPTTKRDDLRLSEIEAELAGTQSLGRDYGHYSNHRADSQSGTYNGPITAETDHHLVQQISARSNVIHEKQRLSPVPALGESVAVSYKRGVANVLQQRDSDRDLSRAVGMAR